MTIKVVSWNVAKRHKPWKELVEMGADVALLQEVGTVPPWVAEDPRVAIGPRERWDSHAWLADAAGDLNVSFRSADPFDQRAQTVLDRMDALGLEYVGPTYPNGRRASPVPRHLTDTSLDVPTYHTTRGNPATAYVQIDHAFASRGFHDSVRTCALNGVEEWGSSDHCRVLIEVETKGAA